jgi:hypothetical protein
MRSSTFCRIRPTLTILTSCALLASSLTAGASGRIIAAFDDWTLSDSGFANAPDTGQFVTNIATWFARGHPGRFLCASSFNAYSQNAKFRYAITNAGHTLTMTNVSLDTFSLETWLTYDALFIGDATLDNAKLTNYVNAGGSVYVYGIGAGGDPARWNAFLLPFGLAFGSTLSGNQVNAITNAVHPLFQGVTNVYYYNGVVVQVTNTPDPRSRVLQYNPAGKGMFAVWDPAAANPPQLSISPTNLQLIGNVGTSNRVEYVTNLADTVWLPLTNIFLTQSNCFFSDADFPNSPQRLYRAVQLP